MPRVGFEPTVSAFARAKTVHALDRSSLVTGNYVIRAIYFTINTALMETEGRTSFNFLASWKQSCIRQNKRPHYTHMSSHFLC
jgi:hypothetical protein